jgi:hypothetical protein
VKAIDTMDNVTTSSTRTLTVDTVPPLPFTLLTPTNLQTVRGFVNVSWNPTTDATSGVASYKIFEDGVLKGTVGAATNNYTVTGVTNAVHTIYVEAVDNAGNTTDSNTNSIQGYGAIPVPTLVAPTNGTKTNAVPTMKWTWPSDGGPTPTSYDVLVDGSTVVSGVPYAAGTMSTAIPDPGDGVHTWKVQQTDPYTGTVTSVQWTFTLDRTPPTNAGPLTRTTTTVSWPAVTDPATPTATGVAKIEFYIDNGSGYALAATLGAGATSYNYGVLPDGVYQMKTRAYDNAGNTTDSPPITIMNDSTPPAAFTLIQPVNPALPPITTAAAPPACAATPTFDASVPVNMSWNASSDAVSGLQRYDVSLDGTVLGSTAAPGTSYTATGVSSGAHSWKVTAFDNFGNSTVGTPTPLAVRFDSAAPSATAITPANASFTASTTPTLHWSATDDSCVARVNVYLDGALAATASGSENSWTVPAASALAEGAHTWQVRAFDTLGNQTASAVNSFTVDLTPPTGITAINPADASSVPEGYFGGATAFSWTAGSDALSGVSRYDLWIDGSLRESGLASPAALNTYAIHAGPHTWSVVAYDAVGNHATFNFSFTATPVVDTTPPTAFHLLTPTNGQSIASPNTLTWSAATDFNGIAQYKVFIDGAQIGTTTGGTTSFPISTTSGGAPQCVVDFDPSVSQAGCVDGNTYASPWSVGTHSGNVDAGNGLGVDAYDGNGTSVSAAYTLHVPSTGADLKFDSHWDTERYGSSAYDGGTVELRYSNNGGSTWSGWLTTCNVGTATSVSCADPAGSTSAGSTVSPGTTYTDKTVTPNKTYDLAIMAPVGGYTDVLASGSGNTLGHEDVFAGTQTGMTQSTMHMSQWAGKLVQVRFRLGMDTCYTGMPAAQANVCNTNHDPAYKASWDFDNIELTDPVLALGPHTWYVQAFDPAGNMTQSAETWGFTLT